MPPVMPIGKYKGLPISAMRTAYLLWWSSQDSLRRTRPATANAILAELGHRFNQAGRVEGELLPDFCDLA